MTEPTQQPQRTQQEIDAALFIAREQGWKSPQETAQMSRDLAEATARAGGMSGAAYRIYESHKNLLQDCRYVFKFWGSGIMPNIHPDAAKVYKDLHQHIQEAERVEFLQP